MFSLPKYITKSPNNVGIVVAITILIIGSIFIFRKRENFMELEEYGCYTISRTNLNSVDPDNMQGTASIQKILNADKTLEFSVEANLPMASGGDFNDENVIYELHSGIDEKSLKKICDLERQGDGFYKCKFSKESSSSKEYNSYISICIFSNDENGLFPVLKGEFKRVI